MKTIKEILIEARARVEKGWCQGVMAKDAEGRQVGIDEPAACYCSLGALIVAYSGEFNTPDEIYQAFTIPNGVEGIVEWNDKEGRTKEEVLSAFDRAIEAAS